MRYKKTKYKSPVFIVGVPRSGTTLLRVILGSHPKLLSLPELPWIFGSYGNLDFFSFLNNLVTENIGPVESIKNIKEDDIYRSGRIFINEIFNNINQEKKTLLIKTPDDIKNVSKISKTFPDSHIIHIIRDGRDVAQSMINPEKESFFGKTLVDYGELNVTNVLQRWYDWEEIFKQTRTQIRNPIIDVKYEELVDNPQQVIKTICKKINIRYSKKILKYWQFPHPYPKWEAGSFDTNRKHSIDASSVGKYKNNTNLNTINIPIHIQDLLKKYNYDI